MVKSNPEREIQKEPEAPLLTESTIHLLSELCFRRNDELLPTELLFVFGTRKESNVAANKVRAVLDVGVARLVMLTGGPTQGFNIPESTVLLDAINPMDYPEIDFLQEVESTNSKANVLEALRVYDFSRLSTVTFIGKAQVAGRFYLTLRNSLPHTRILQAAYGIAYPDTNGVLNSQNWHQTEAGRRRVWGEFLRIVQYGERGDLALNEVQGQVEQIKHTLQN